MFSLRRESSASIEPLSPLPPPHPIHPLLHAADYKSRRSAGPFDDRAGASTMRFVGACENARVRVCVCACVRARSSPLSNGGVIRAYSRSYTHAHTTAGSEGGREEMARDESASLTGY